MKAVKFKNIKSLVITILVVTIINIIGGLFFKRFDLTHDKRYTLSEATVGILKNIDEPVYFTVLLEGDFPAEFKRLKNETRQLLEEFQAINNHVGFEVVDPLEGEDNPEQVIFELDKLGLSPTNIPLKKQGNQTIVKVFPWVIASKGEKSVRVPLLVNNLGISASENIQKSIEQLEYAFSDAIIKLNIKDKKSIAVLKGNGQISDKYLADVIQGLKDYYWVEELSLNDTLGSVEKTFENLKRFDAALIAKPTKPFSDKDKYLLDQYAMHGKKLVWLLDKVAIDLDSLRNESSTNIAFPMDLNVDDMLFKYGVRINYNLVQDYISVPITFKDEDGSDLPFDWLYSPMVPSKENHPINKNLNVMKLEFANQMDTLANGIKKTVLLESSALTKVVGTPAQVSLLQFEEINPEELKSGPQIFGVLLEGEFTSAYHNRVKPISLKENLEKSTENKMVVISDGDVVNNMYANKKLLVNGYDNWTQQVYANKDFMVNTFNYLLDDNGILEVRLKEVKLAFMDKEKLQQNYTSSKWITVGLPVALLILFGAVFNYLRKRKFTQQFK